MNFPRLFVVMALVLFGVIGVLSLFKRGEREPELEKTVVVHTISQPVEVEFEKEIRSVGAVESLHTANLTEVIQTRDVPEVAKKPAVELPTADRIEELFRKVDPRLPIVETISYKSRVPWLKGRPAWVSDYAGYYKTSRHFIARSLNGKKDYLKQNVSIGDRFNVFKPDLEINFYLVIDVSRSKMWFYYHDVAANERVLLKTYDIGLGRVDSSQASGLLTPLGTFTLGDKVGIYKPKQKGTHNGDKVEMIRIFGTRWIPFDQEVEGCTTPAKGFGIHGVPWKENETGELVEDTSSIGKYESDGCIRFKSDDIEEIFAIIITKPTYVMLVKDFFEAKLPGIEKK